MERNFDKVLLGLALAVCVAGTASPARGQSGDEEAIRLANEALLSDYLAMNFDAAISKLQQALSQCGENNCGTKTLGRIHRDLAVIYIAGLGQPAEGKAEFVAALSADPRVKLDEDLSTAEVKAAFAEVQASMGGGGAAGGGVGAMPNVGSEPVPESGDLVHVPPTEQLTLTPLPLYVEVAGGTELTRIQVRYQSPTGRDWLTAQMQPVETGFGVEIDCTHVGSTPGIFRYYIQGFDGNDPVSFSGTAKIPHQVNITTQLSGEPPALPGKPPPRRCETEECVPGMVIPGCPMPEGEDCQVDEDCEGALVCQNEICSKETGPEKPKVHWLSFAFQQDFVLFPAEQGICSGGNDYTCFFADNIEYLGIPDVGNGNEIMGGFGMATQRFLFGYDYRFPMGLAIGLRGGFAMSGGPKSAASTFLPVHVEGRVAYYHRAGSVEPYAMLVGGMAQVDARITASIQQTTPDAPLIFAGTDINTLPPTNVDAWRRAGRGFVALGGGLRVLAGKKKSLGPFLEVRGGRTFPASTTILGAQLGMSLGF